MCRYGGNIGFIPDCQVWCLIPLKKCYKFMGIDFFKWTLYSFVRSVMSGNSRNIVIEHRAIIFLH